MVPLILMALLSGDGKAQAAPADCGPMRHAAEEYRQAILSRDRERLIAMFADKVNGCGDSSVSRAIVGASIRGPGTALESLLFDAAAIARDETLRQYFKESAVDFMKRPDLRVSVDERSGGTPSSGSFTFTAGALTHEVFVTCTGGRWRIQSWPYECYVGM
jgi:hypothetical protein